jgi:hypothetical protein
MAWKVLLFVALQPCGESTRVSAPFPLVVYQEERVASFQRRLVAPQVAAVVV